MDQDQNPTSGDGDNSPSDHEMYVKVEKPTPESRDRSSTPEDCAIEDSDEDDEEMVEIQRSMTQSRMMKQKSPEELRKKVIPFHWAPMLSPLTSADVDACETLERAALRGQRQISSKEQVNVHSLLPHPPFLPLRLGHGLCITRSRLSIASENVEVFASAYSTPTGPATRKTGGFRQCVMRGQSKLVGRTDPNGSCLLILLPHWANIQL